MFQKLAKKLKTPREIQRFLRDQFPYNFEKKGETLRSAFSALQAGEAHCLEASLLAAAILEYRGYPPLVMSMESLDDLDHVVFIYKEKSGWGSIGRSREPGLHGRAPIFRSVRDLALSYSDPFVDKTGALTGYGTANLDEMGVNWRSSPRNVWKVERYLIDLPHTDFKKTPAWRSRFKKLRIDYFQNGPIQTGKHWW